MLHGNPTSPLHKTLAKALLSPRHAELAVGPRFFLEKDVHARVIGLLLHLRDPLPGASKNDRHRMSSPPGLVSYSTGTVRSTSHRLAGSFGPTVYDVAAQGVCHSSFLFRGASVDWLAACCGS